MNPCTEIKQIERVFFIFPRLFRIIIEPNDRNFFSNTANSNKMVHTNFYIYLYNNKLVMRVFLDFVSSGIYHSENKVNQNGNHFDNVVMLNILSCPSFDCFREYVK